MCLRNKKMINYHIKGLYKTTFCKTKFSFSQFFFSHGQLHKFFFSFLIKAFTNFEKLIRFHWQTLIVYKNRETLKMLIEMFCQKLIVSDVVLAFLDIWNLKFPSSVIHGGQCRALPLFKISGSAPDSIPNFVQLTFKFLKKFLWKSRLVKLVSFLGTLWEFRNAILSNLFYLTLPYILYLFGINVGWCYWMQTHKRKQQSYSVYPSETSTLSYGRATNVAIITFFMSAFQFSPEKKSISILTFDALGKGQDLNLVRWVFLVLKHVYNLVNSLQILIKCGSLVKCASLAIVDALVNYFSGPKTKISVF